MAIDGSMNIVQVQSMTWTTATFMDNCQSRQDITGWVETITAKLTGSKILVHAQFTGILDCDGRVGFKRDGNVVVDNWLGTDRDVAGDGGYHDSNTYSGMYLDDFSTTAGQTYSYQMTTIVTGCGDDAYFNRDPSNSSNNGRSSLTLFEVSG